VTPDEEKAREIALYALEFGQVPENLMQDNINAETVKLFREVGEVVRHLQQHGYADLNQKKQLLGALYGGGLPTKLKDYLNKP
jgi:hypothetical protein